jgi:3-isopropylmalate dehydrogenase
MAAIASAAMMLDTLGEYKAAEAVDVAMTKALGSGKFKSLSAGRMGMSTSEAGDLIAGLV